MRRWRLSWVDGAWRYGARGAPWRWDLCALTVLPVRVATSVQAERLCRQVRQDVWRGCRALRGFSPMVALAPSGDQTRLWAGGVLRTGTMDASVHGGRVASLLDHPAARARWCAQVRALAQTAQPGHETPQ